MATDEPMDSAREQSEQVPSSPATVAVEASASAAAPAAAVEAAEAASAQEIVTQEPQAEEKSGQQEEPHLVSESDTESEEGGAADDVRMSVDSASVAVVDERPDTQDDADDGNGHSELHQQIESVAMSVVAHHHHATNLLHEAVERQQKMREDKQHRMATSPVLVAVNPHPEAVQSEATDDEDVKTKSIPDLYYLFTNDKLKEEPLTKVLNSDPFCIPRLTDNVPEYRPAFNPLSILEGEEKLLPRYFRLDPFEGIPGAASKANGANSDSDGRGGGGAVSQREKNARDRSTMSSIPIRAKKAHPSSAAVSAFKGKTSTFMGTLPRQSEFSEIPVADTLFQTQQTFRPTPPPPPAPHPSYASKSISAMHAARSQSRDWDTTPVTTPIAAGAMGSSSSVEPTAETSSSVLPAALNDAIFLTSLHQSGGVQQHAYSHADHQFHHDYYASSEAREQQQYSQAQYEQQQHMYHQEQQQQSGADRLSRFIPSSRPGSSALSESHSSGGSGSPSSYIDEASYLGEHLHSQSRSHPYHNHNSNEGGGQYMASMFEDYRDSVGSQQQQQQQYQHGYADSAPQRMSMSSQYSDGGVSSAQQQQLGDTQSLQPIPKKPRSKNVFRPCTAPGCTKGARGKSGLCQKHGGGKRCAMDGCSKGAQGSSAMCLFHGGGYRCTVDGCSTGARGTSGLCAKHGGYKRGKEPGGGGGVSPTSSSNGNSNGKRPRTQDSPMDFGDHSDAAMDTDTPRFSNLLC